MNEPSPISQSDDDVPVENNIPTITADPETVETEVVEVVETSENQVVGTGKRRGRPKKEVILTKMPAGHKAVLDWLLKDENLATLQGVLTSEVSSGKLNDTLPDDIKLSKSAVSRFVTNMKSGQHNDHIDLHLKNNPHIDKKQIYPKVRKKKGGD